MRLRELQPLVFATVAQPVLGAEGRYPRSRSGDAWSYLCQYGGVLPSDRQVPEWRQHSSRLGYRRCHWSQL